MHSPQHIADPQYVEGFSSATALSPFSKNKVKSACFVMPANLFFFGMLLVLMGSHGVHDRD
jgi:hypothetical protein